MKPLATVRVIDIGHIAEGASRHATERVWRQMRAAAARRYSESGRN